MSRPDFTVFIQGPQNLRVCAVKPNCILSSILVWLSNPYLRLGQYVSVLEPKQTDARQQR